MKAIVLSAALLMFTWLSSAVAQDRDEDENITNVPAKVKSEFSKLYPNIKDVSWSKEEGVYEGKFTSGSDKMAVHIDDQGNLTEKEKYISVSDLPKTAQDYLTKNYSGMKFNEVSEVTKTSDNQKYFEVETKDKELTFDSKGNFLKEEKNDEDE